MKFAPILPQKPRLHVSNDEQAIVARRSLAAVLGSLVHLLFWFLLAAFIGGFFWIVWSGQGEDISTGGALVLFLVLGSFMAVFLYVFYHALVRLVDRVEFCVTDRDLEVRFRPLPWFGGRRISHDQLRRLFVDRHRFRTGATVEWTGHAVFALHRDGGRSMLYAFYREEDAQFVAETLQGWIDSRS